MLSHPFFNLSISILFSDCKSHCNKVYRNFVAFNKVVRQKAGWNIYALSVNEETSNVRHKAVQVLAVHDYLLLGSMRHEDLALGFCVDARAHHDAGARLETQTQTVTRRRDL